MVIINCIEWFQNWVHSVFEQRKKINILVVTIDNPGWGVIINLKDYVQKSNLLLAESFKTDDLWFHCATKNSEFEGVGGLFNLLDVFQVLHDLIVRETNFHLSNEEEKLTMNDDLGWLMQWFSSQCDGDWEHTYGVRMSISDESEQPSWFMRVALIETELENELFDPLLIKRSETDWLSCSIVDKRFVGKCGLLNLSEMLKLFREWAEKSAG